MTQNATPADADPVTGVAASNGHPTGNGKGGHAGTNGHSSSAGNGLSAGAQGDSAPATHVSAKGHAAGDTSASPASHLSPRLALFDKCRAYDIPAKIKAAGVWTYFRAIESAQDPEVYIDGQKLVMLGSNNYLGLTTHPKVKEASIEAVRKFGTGCAGSRLLNGTMKMHEELEEKLADFMGYGAAVTFSTGFQVNLGTIACLVDRRDVVYLDKQDHACIIDGARLGLGETRKFKHNSAADLRRMMAGDAEAAPAKRPAGRLVVVDGVYSMEGDICPLPEIVAVAKQFEAAVMVDDAHGIGVLGKGGRGTAEHFGLEKDVHLIMGTFSKSLASVGGFVCGDRETMDFVRHRARPHMFSAAPSPANVAAASAAVDIVKAEPERREMLWHNTQFMLAGLRSLGFDTGDSRTPVIPVVVGEDYTAFGMATRLQQEGVFVNAVVSPATPPGRALLRTSYMATHTETHLSFALDKFAKVGREFGVIR